MAVSCGQRRPSLFDTFLVLCLLLPSSTVNSTPVAAHRRTISAHLRRLNKPASPDGDLIDCIPSHLQPAFDHPKLRGPGRRRPLDPPERPRGHNASSSSSSFHVQAWASSGESCPEETVPIRRTMREDVLRASSIQRFGRKPAVAALRRDSISSAHEHAIGYAMGNHYYGAKAGLNVWTPRVTSASEFSLSQIWVISGSFSHDLNTIEAGWQVSPQLYGDNRPRFFTYWTSDAYRETGCYNLLCSGFVQTNNKIAIGAAISPTSSLNNRQFDISLLIWKWERPNAWELVAGVGLGNARRLLAVLLVQSLGEAREHAAVRGRGRQHPAIRQSHVDPNGERSLRDGRNPASFLLPQSAGRGLGQQPGAVAEPPAAG
ncbi:hypothetical protein ZIOFF_064319 [Zingiber officinale]|uniref:Neprosin PEP catalytic domain-containing protein n=1 Tax=Zingiber officinale TaxID=94328 RepID=A0A8J5EW78_ZINOF|nr:hypothetical protein ZIOFF_064319 [Zingiber officinale]